MIPNRCAKTRVQLGDTVVQVFSCFVDHPRELPEEEWTLRDDVLVDVHSSKLFGWHDVGWITHHDTIVAAKISSDIDERSIRFIQTVKEKLAENPHRPDEPDEPDEPNVTDVTPPDPASDNTRPESKARSATTLQSSFEKLSVE